MWKVNLPDVEQVNNYNTFFFLRVKVNAKIINFNWFHFIFCSFVISAVALWSQAAYKKELQNVLERHEPKLDLGGFILWQQYNLL